MQVVMAVQTKVPLPSEDEFIAGLRARFPEVTFEAAGTKEELLRLIRDAEVCYGIPSREAFLAAGKLRWVHCPGAGIDAITKIPELIDGDVVLTNARGPHAGPMADHVFGLIINLAHRWRQAFEDQRQHRWDSWRMVGKYVELGGSTMGILALGDIGKAVARRAQGFGIHVYAVDRYPPAILPAGVEEAWGLDRLDEMLTMSDWFVVTAPLTPGTRGLIDRRRVESLKEGAFVIVVSRGGIVDEEALADGLRSGRIAGAGLDVFAHEPLAEESPLWDMENVVITPHASAHTPEMVEARRAIFEENLRRFLADERFLYVCDKRAGF